MVSSWAIGADGGCVIQETFPGNGILGRMLTWRFVRSSSDIAKVATPNDDGVFVPPGITMSRYSPRARSQIRNTPSCPTWLEFARPKSAPVLPDPNEGCTVSIRKFVSVDTPA